MDRAYRLLVRAVALAELGCASGAAFRPDVVLWHAEDPVGDVRLGVPPSADVSKDTFDVTAVTLGTTDTHLIARIAFADEVPLLRFQRVTEYQPTSVVPQTVDIYLDLVPEAGHVEALPGRGFHVPSAEAWERVLVMSSVTSMREDGVVRPVHLVRQGKDWVGAFPLSEIPGTIRGALAVVLATAPLGEGRVRAVTPWQGNCETWDPYFRCTLTGEPPAVLDAVPDIWSKQPVPLAYFGAPRPTALMTPVVFARGELVSAAPVDAARVAEGHLATVYGPTGEPLATAVVVSVVGDTASLKVLDGAAVESAASVTFGGAGP